MTLPQKRARAVDRLRHERVRVMKHGDLRVVVGHGLGCGDPTVAHPASGGVALQRAERGVGLVTSGNPPPPKRKRKKKQSKKKKKKRSPEARIPLPCCRGCGLRHG